MEKNKEEKKEIEKNLAALRKSAETKKEDVKTEKPKFVFPRSEATVYGYDVKNKMFYFGIPVDKTDAFIATCIIDSLKLKYVSAFNMFLQNKSKIMTADKTAFQKMKDFVSKKR